MVRQQETQRPVQFEITPGTREALRSGSETPSCERMTTYFSSRLHDSPHLGTRQYARIVDGWIGEARLDPTGYRTHSIRRTKQTLIYRRTKNLGAVQLLMVHTESTVRYLGIEVDDALEIAEQTEV